MRAAAAGMFIRKLRKFAVDQRLHGIPNRLKVPAEINHNTDLVESHERAKPHAADNQLAGAFSGQILYRRHASALLMRDIWDHINFFYFIIFHCNHSIEIAVTKMRAQWSVKPAWCGRRDSY